MKHRRIAGGTASADRAVATRNTTPRPSSDRPAPCVVNRCGAPPSPAAAAEGTRTPEATPASSAAARREAPGLSDDACDAEEEEAEPGEEERAAAAKSSMSVSRSSEGV